MTDQTGILATALRLLWRRQAVLWWLFGVNFLMAYLATVPVRLQLGFLVHSLVSDALYSRFQISTLGELLRKPEVNPAVALSGSLGLMLAYFVFALFLTGGILEAFYTDRRMGAGEFFRACGEYFWRLLRLVAAFAVFLVPLLLAQSAWHSWTGKLSDTAPQEQLAFWLEIGGLLVLSLIALALRLWFDLAQIHTVADNEHAVRRSLVRAARTPGFARLYALFVVINVLGLIAFVLLFVILVRLPHQRVGLTLVLGEFMVVVWVATRLWERAAEVVFYRRTRPAAALAAPAPAEEVPSPTLESPPAAV